MDNNDNKNSLIPFEWAIKEISQPTLNEIGLDLKNGYVGLKKIIINAIKKTKVNNGVANNRVMIEALRSGSFIDSDIGVEYFGGILASSKSIEGKDDSAIYYLDIIKSMSSNQLYLHYVIYRTLNKLLINDFSKINLNVGLSSDLQKEKIFFSTLELNNILNINMETDLEALFRKGLLSEYKTDLHKIDQIKQTPYSMVSPTTLGIQLFSVANNRLSDWRSYPSKDFNDFENIKMPVFFGSNLEDFLKKAKLI